MIKSVVTKKKFNKKFLPGGIFPGFRKGRVYRDNTTHTQESGSYAGLQGYLCVVQEVSLLLNWG